MSEEVIVIKSSGDREPFSEKKYRRSLERSGASENVISETIKEIKKIFDGEITTKKLYEETEKILQKKEQATAGRYNLKRAIFDFGPSGFPFERYVATLFEYLGYKVEVGQILQGKCIKHEVDIVGYKDNIHTLIECKFHNARGIYTSIKIPLYVKARFDDLNESPGDIKESHFHEGYVVTNTRFSQDSMDYAACRGLRLLAWNHPKGEGLKEIIDRSGLHPITSLSSIGKKHKNQLLKEGIVSCIDIQKKTKKLRDLGMSNEEIDKVIIEARSLCRKEVK